MGGPGSGRKADGGTVDAAGAAPAASGNGSHAGELRAAGAEARAGGSGKATGSKAKKPAAPAPAPTPSKAPDFVYSKTGKAFRAIGNIAAVQTNNKVWLLSPDEEKDLGESVGDIFLELGLSDTLAVKIIFAVGTVTAVFGSKAIAYGQYRASLPPAPAARPPLPGNVKTTAPAPAAPVQVPDPVMTAAGPGVSAAEAAAVIPDTGTKPAGAAL